MAGLFTRLKESITSDLHDLLDQKEEKNPMAALNQYLRQSEQEVEKVRKLVARQHCLKEEFTREYVHALEMAEKRQHQAAVALQAEEKSMHSFASKEFEQYKDRAYSMQKSQEQASEQLEVLEQKYEEMKRKLKDMQLKRMEMMGKENVARAHYTVNRVLDHTANPESTRFSEMERYIEGLEQKVSSAYYRQTFDSKMDQLEKQMKEKEKSAQNN